MSAASGRIYLRAATADDQHTIRRFINTARLNPMHLDWPNFIVAEEIGLSIGDVQIVGMGQIKPHPDGSRELASIAVLSTHQRLGLAALIIQTLLAHENGAVYLYCGDTMPAYYTRFSFVEVSASALPASIRRWFRLWRTAIALLTLLPGERHSLHAMRRNLLQTRSE